MNSKADNWKNELRETIIKCIVGKASQKDYADIAYAYHWLAPSSIYKYYSDDLRNVENTRNNVMWYSAPSKFNDVFDAVLSADRDAIFQSILGQVQDDRGVRAGSPMWKQIQAVTTSAVKELNQTLGAIRKTTGVSCFSESEESLLMWSHYAHHHRGMCVEFELIQFNDEIGFPPVPVIYSEKKPCMQKIDLNDPNTVAQICLVTSLTTKSKEWSYEREWRIIRDEGACGSAWNAEKQGALLPSIMPKSVILGCDARGEFEKAVHDCCEERKINLFQMEKDEAEYKLNKKQILVFNE